MFRPFYTNFLNFTMLRSPDDAGAAPVGMSNEQLMGMIYEDEAPKDEAPKDEAPKDEAPGEDVDGEAPKDEAPKDEAPGEDTGDDSPKYVVKVDGKEFEITEEELLQGYQRQADYTRKTQQLAEQRRALDAERDATIPALKNALAYFALPQNSEPKPEQFPGKPDQFVSAYQKWQVGKEQQVKAQEILKAITDEETKRVLAKEADLLRSAIPEWQDETVRQAEIKGILEVATERYGFTPEEISEATDHRLFVLLRDAARASVLEKKPILLKRKTETPVKMEPGQKKPLQTIEIKRKIAMDQLKANGRVDADSAVTLLFNS